MSVSPPARGLQNLEEMRLEFDRSFAVPDPPPPGIHDDFVAIRIHGRPFALRVAELLRLEKPGKIIALPGGNSWLLGLTSSLGKLVPVYSLEAALGFDRTPGAPGWLAICGLDERLGLTFDLLEGYLRTPRASLLNCDPNDSHGIPSAQAVVDAGTLRPIVNLHAIIAGIRQRISPSTAHREAPDAQ